MTRATEDHVARAERFHRLHDGPRPLLLVNAWDRFSTRVLTLAGAPAVGTSSFAVALARGYQDGQRIPWAVARDVIAEVSTPPATPRSRPTSRPARGLHRRRSRPPSTT